MGDIVKKVETTSIYLINNEIASFYQIFKLGKNYYTWYLIDHLIEERFEVPENVTDVRYFHPAAAGRAAQEYITSYMPVLRNRAENIARAGVVYRFVKNKKEQSGGHGDA